MRSPRLFALAAALAVAVALACSPARADESKWVSLFNGKDLTGWKLSNKMSQETKWEVKDGLLVGTGPAGMLFHEGEYTNFRYRVEAMINDNGNSGQYFRCTDNPGFLDGYEAQINATHGDRIKTGSLYKFKETYILDTAPHKPGEFFVQEVVAEGNKVTIFVNGKQVSETTDPKETFKSGRFAIQQHDPKSVITIRKVEVMELPASK